MDNGNPIMRVVNAVTEGADFMEAAHDALPCNMRARKGAPPDEQFKALWRNFDSVHIPTLINNLILNQFEDFLYGTLGQAQKGVNQSTGQSYGKQQHTLRVADRAMRRMLDELPDDLAKDIKEAYNPIEDLMDKGQDLLDALTKNVGLMQRMKEC